MSTLAATGFFGALSGCGERVASLAWRGIDFPPVTMAGCDLSPLNPTLYRLTRPVFVAPHWPILSGQDRVLIADGATVEPYAIMGTTPSLQRPFDTIPFTLEGVATECDAEVFFLGGDVAGNYYHWLIDYLPRLALYRLSPYYDPRRPVAVTQAVPRSVAEVLAEAGLAAQPMWPLAQHGAYRFPSALVVSALTYREAVHPLAVQILRNLLRQHFAPTATRRLLVSRQEAGSRRLLNEDEVFSTLEPLGFERVSLSGLSLHQQVALFSAAEMVVSPHGAGLTNLVWLPAGRARVVELAPTSFTLGMYRVLTEYVGGHYVRLEATAEDVSEPNNSMADFRIDPARIVRALGE